LFSRVHLLMRARFTASAQQLSSCALALALAFTFALAFTSHSHCTHSQLSESLIYNSLPAARAIQTDSERKSV